MVLSFTLSDVAAMSSEQIALQLSPASSGSILQSLIASQPSVTRAPGTGTRFVLWACLIIFVLVVCCSWCVACYRAGGVAFVVMRSCCGGGQPSKAYRLDIAFVAAPC